MNENFRSILDGLGEEMSKLGFAAHKNDDGSFVAEENGSTVARYSGEKGVVAVSLTDGKLSLLSGDDAEAPESTPNKLSVTLLDENADSRDVKYIINEFSDTLEKKFAKKTVAPKKPAQKAAQTVSKAAVKNGSFYDASTLASKLCLVFPELRPLYKENIAKYNEFLGEEFFTKYASAKVIEAIKANDPQTMKKMFQILNEIYEDGTNDTQSLIAVTILGGLNNDKILLARCVDYMSETMAPPVIEVNRLLASASGKKLKKQLSNPPAYKPKKQKKPGFFAQAMNQGMQQPPMM